MKCWRCSHPVSRGWGDPAPQPPRDPSGGFHPVGLVALPVEQRPVPVGAGGGSNVTAGWTCPGAWRELRTHHFIPLRGEAPASLAHHLLHPQDQSCDVGQSHGKELCFGGMPGGSPAAPVDPRSLRRLGRAERGFGFS